MIDVDLRPDIGVELDARVEADESGEGRIVPAAAQRWLRELRALIGEDVRVTLRRWRKRTPRQNAYLWSVVYPFVLDGLRQIAFDAGEACPFANVEELHEAAKMRWLGTSVRTFRGESFEMPPSTTRLSTSEFAAYVERIAAWAAGLGIYIPSPNYEEPA